MTLSKGLVRHISTTIRDPTKTGVKFRLPPSRRRQSLRSKLGHVGRVHAPEADMRPLLPFRDVLLNSVRLEKNEEKALRPRQSRPRRGLAELADQSADYARRFDMAALSAVVRRALRPPLETDMSRWHRAVVMNAVIGGSQSHEASTMDEVMSVLTTHGILDKLPPRDVGPVLDVLVRHKLRTDDDVAAFRGELMSRALDSRLSARTYAELLERCDNLDGALSLLHRAVAVGVNLSVTMLNKILELCFERGDGMRARRVIAEMARRRLRPNKRTLAALLAQADGVEGVDTVFRVVRRAGHAPPDAADVFLRAYASIGTQANDDEYIGGCFTVIDWFFDSGIGVRRHALDALVEHFARHGHVEAALRAWREMRRGWLGAPSIRSRVALWNQLLKRGGLRDAKLRERLTRDLNAQQLSKLHRCTLRESNDTHRDLKVLKSGSVKDKATVLHRWGREGRSEQVRTWIQVAVDARKGKGIDIGLLLPLLSDTGESRFESVKLLVGHLSSGQSICGDKNEVVRRATDRLWQWMLTESDHTFEGSVSENSILSFVEAPEYTENMTASDFDVEQFLQEHGTDLEEKDEELKILAAGLLAGLDKIVRVCDEDGNIRR